MWQLRRVVGDSMSPSFHEGQILVISTNRENVHSGDVVVISHAGLSKLKRITELDDARIFVEGDNAMHSTDSRQFGWLPRAAIQARVIWPKRAV